MGRYDIEIFRGVLFWFWEKSSNLQYLHRPSHDLDDSGMVKHLSSSIGSDDGIFDTLLSTSTAREHAPSNVVFIHDSGTFIKQPGLLHSLSVVLSFSTKSLCSIEAMSFRQWSTHFVLSRPLATTNDHFVTMVCGSERPVVHGDAWSMLANMWAGYLHPALLARASRIRSFLLPSC